MIEKKTRKGLSTSKFILPYIYKSKNSKKRTPFFEEDWKQYQISTKYLVHSVNDLFSEKSNQVCKCYSLNDASRVKYNIPARWTLVEMKSQMYGAKGKYSFYLSGHRIIQFESGIGFLVLEVQYPKDDIENIIDIGFCLSNVFTNEHDSGEKDNNLEFSYMNNGEEISFSIKNSLIDLLQGDINVNDLRLFPSASRKRLITYHSTFTNGELNDYEKYLYCLSNSLHTGINYDKASDLGVEYSSFAKQRWNISTNGVSSHTLINEENRDFVLKAFKRNADMDYFIIFILTLHGREIMLEYNHFAILERDKVKKLIKLKKDLLEADILYSFNTVSIEASYQEFYNHLSNVFNLDSLRSDIRDVIENVESQTIDNKDRKINTILTALSLLAVFSVLTDGIGFADRIQSGDPFGVLQWGVILVVVICILVALIVLRRNR